MPPKIYSAYDLPEDPGILCEDLSLTQQHFLEECDINIVMERAESTGTLPTPIPSFYGDFSDPLDFMTVHQKMQKVQSEFQALPAKIRERFQNDPYGLVEFAHNPENLQEGIQLGIFEPPPAAPEPASKPAVTAGETS